MTFRRTLGAAVAGAAMLAAGSSFATPLVFTISPGALGLIGGNVTADTATITNYSSSTFNGLTGDFTEVGDAAVSGFTLGPSGVFASNLNTPSTSGGGWAMYVTFSANGNIVGGIPGTVGTTNNGLINGLTFSMWAVHTTAGIPTNTSGGPTFTVSDGSVVVGNNAGAIEVATGSEIGSGNTGSVTLATLGQYSSNAQVLTTLIPTAAGIPFFVSPNPLVFDLFLESSFTNTSGVSTVDPGTPPTAFLNVSGGGGNINLLASVPEPVSLAVLGVGMLGLGFARRRRQ